MWIFEELKDYVEIELEDRIWVADLEDTWEYYLFKSRLFMRCRGNLTEISFGVWHKLERRYMFVFEVPEYYK